MFGRQPTIPPAIRERLEQPLMMDGSSRAADQLLLRAEDIRRHSILAGEALKIAQHRDTLQYARARGGGYHPKVRKFEVGDFVYVRPAGEDTKRNLVPLASNLILRVAQVNPSGVLILQGKDGLTAPYQQTRCAPCHLANIDPAIDYTLARPSKKWPCQGCKQYSESVSMLLCDTCGDGWHMSCLCPSLSEVPLGPWQCPKCAAAGIPLPVPASYAEPDGCVLEPALVPNRLEESQPPTQELPEAPSTPTVMAPATVRWKPRVLPREKRPGTPNPWPEPDAALHGRYVTKNFAKRRFWGVVQYLGEDEPPPYVFCIWYEDGDSELVTRAELSRLLVPKTVPLPALVLRFKPPDIPSATHKVLTTCKSPFVGCTYRAEEHLMNWREEVDCRLRDLYHIETCTYPNPYRRQGQRTTDHLHTHISEAP